MRVVILLVTMDMITSVAGVYEGFDGAKAYVEYHHHGAVWEKDYGHTRAKIGGKHQLEYEIVEAGVQQMEGK